MLSLKNYDDVDKTAEAILNFRQKYNSFKTENEQEKFRVEFLNKYLSDFKNPAKNTLEYANNMIRYMRLTKYIRIRGKYSQEERRNYMGIYGAYPLPFETAEKLKEILSKINEDINAIEKKLGIPQSFSDKCSDHEEYKTEIERRRQRRTELQNLEIKQEYHDSVQKINEAIKALEDIRAQNRANLAKKYSIELEKWVNIALNIINDSIRIKPNAPVGDDN